MKLSRKLISPDWRQRATSIHGDWWGLSSAHGDGVKSPIGS